MRRMLDMSPAQQASFDIADMLNREAGELILNGRNWDAAMTLHKAADYAVSDQAKAVLLLRASELILGILAKKQQIVH